MKYLCFTHLSPPVVQKLLGGGEKFCLALYLIYTSDLFDTVISILGTHWALDKCLLS